MAGAVKYLCRSTWGFTFYNLSRKYQEARSIPGDKFLSQAPALADVPAPQKGQQ